MDVFFCISYFDGDISWVRDLKSPYTVYNKSGKKLNDLDSVINLDNVGYNISSYLNYVIDNYDDLPEMIVFCKNNVFPRHVTKKIFFEACRKKVFTSIDDPSSWKNLSFPVSTISNGGEYLEINNSWYVDDYPRLYFSDFNQFYDFVFISDSNPLYLNFSPGGNYVVPKNNILQRSLNFYKNLLLFVSHDQFSCESHFVERSLKTIWASNITSSPKMNSLLSREDLQSQKVCCEKDIEKKISQCIRKLTNKSLYTLIRLMFYSRKF